MCLGISIYILGRWYWIKIYHVSGFIWRWLQYVLFHTVSNTHNHLFTHLNQSWGTPGLLRTNLNSERNMEMVQITHKCFTVHGTSRISLTGIHLRSTICARGNGTTKRSEGSLPTQTLHAQFGWPVLPTCLAEPLQLCQWCWQLVLVHLGTVRADGHQQFHSLRHPQSAATATAASTSTTVHVELETLTS